MVVCLHVILHRYCSRDTDVGGRCQSMIHSNSSRTGSLPHSKIVAMCMVTGVLTSLGHQRCIDPVTEWNWRCLHVYSHTHQPLCRAIRQSVTPWWLPTALMTSSSVVMHGASTQIYAERNLLQCNCILCVLTKNYSTCHKVGTREHQKSHHQTLFLLLLSSCWVRLGYMWDECCFSCH